MLKKLYQRKKEENKRDWLLYSYFEKTPAKEKAVFKRLDRKRNNRYLSGVFGERYFDALEQRQAWEELVDGYEMEDNF